MGRREYLKQIASFQERIAEHQEKMKHERSLPQPNEARIRHWQIEIETFQEEIKKAEKRLRRGTR